jgi:hypothetical protein
LSLTRRHSLAYLLAHDAARGRFARLHKIGIYVDLKQLKPEPDETIGSALIERYVRHIVARESKKR